MSRRAAPGAGSSYLVSLPAIAFFAVLSVITVYFSYLLMAAVALFIFVLAVSARLWGSLAMNHVSLHITADRTMMYPGESTELTYIIDNDKLLPLIWLELSQDMPARRCIMPADGFEEDKRKVFDEKGPLHVVPTLKKGFSFLMGHTRTYSEAIWRAERRGHYAAEGLFLRSGDGFGLARIEREYAASDMPTFYIFPRHIPVDVSMMLRDQWDCSVGRRGYVEDMTVLRGLRPYQDTDSWKRINWRMAARQDEIQVNIYETIQPRSVYFVLDGESFCGMSDGYDELETVLELLGSMITELFAAGVPCGLSLPRSANMPATDIPAIGEGSAERLLCLLTEYDCLAEETESKTLIPSSFSIASMTAAAMSAGKVYILTRNAEDAAARLMPHFDRSRAVLLTWEAPGDEVFACGFSCSSMLSLRKEAAG